MNDTFDDFNFTNFTNNLTNEETTKSKPKNDISFDDSLFLNSQELINLQQSEDCINSSKPEEKCNTSLDTDIFSSPLKHNKSEFFDSPLAGNKSRELFTDSSLADNSKSDIFDSPLVQTNTRDTSDVFDSPLAVSRDKCQLSSWGLPESILEKYTNRNITTMFPWQVECLNKPQILKMNKNLVYSAPTSAGKTLVAEILSIKTVLERGKKVIFILPFVSVVREKMFYFQEIFGGCGVRVEGFMGSYNPPGGFKSIQFAVCTIEKANSLINGFLLDGTLNEIGAVVIDEMHLLGEPNRGYILELLLTKLKYVSLKDSTLQIQIIGMSATLPNLKILADWLNAELYVTDFRPIPLYEQTLINSAIYDNKFNLLRKLEPHPDLTQDTDHILQLCLETITANCSVLIFCPTKNWCENLAQQISSAFWKLGTCQTTTSQLLREQLKCEPILELLQQLKFSPVGLDDVLRKTVSFGVAFHHAGLTLDERDIIESGFRSGIIRVLVATSTLSSGVNLPARRVIIRTPLFHGKPIDALTYRQMIGRAGRMGKDTAGESILVCQKNDEKIVKKLIGEELKPIESCLEGTGRLKRAILEIVASGVASTPCDIQLFAQCTLLAVGNTNTSIIDETLEFLVENEFLRLVDMKYTPSGLGKACLTSSIPPEDGLALLTELDKARQCFVLDSELHLVYLVTPYSACHQWGTIDWMFYLNLWEKLPKNLKKVGEIVGVKESYIVSATRGRITTNTPKLYHKFLVHKRFFIALALQDLVNEKPLSEVCSKFNCNRGMLQSLQLTASTFAGMVTAFSKQLGWSSVEILISQFQDRLHFGVSRDLLDLMRLPLLNGRSARALFNAGLETLIQIANSDIDTIEAIFNKVVPFESGKTREGESEYALNERSKFRNIWITGKEGLTERQAAELVLTSTREFLRVEMGLQEANWEKLALNKSLDFVMTSQDESQFETPIKRRRISINKKNRLEIETIEVCECPKLYQNFTRDLKREKYVCLSLGITEIREKKQIIGLTQQDDSPSQFVHKNRKLNGFGLFWTGNTTYYLDLNKKQNCLDLIREVVSDKQKTVVMYNAKEEIKLLKNCCGIDVFARLEDPKIADWLLEPDGKEKNLQDLVSIYCPNLSKMSDLLDSNDIKVCSTISSFLCFNIMTSVKSELSNLKIFETEMSIVPILARMELTGLGVAKTKLVSLVTVLNQEQMTIEQKAYTLAGRRFSFQSSKDVSKVLHLAKTGTKKRILEKIDSPLSDLIIQWRKINATLTKSIQPLIRRVVSNRIYGTCVMHTSTGRITMHEPNLQNVVKNFDISSGTVSCREAFVPKDGHVMVSADYCQLELRLLAHLSRDEILCGIMRAEGDIFRAVAAKWNGIRESDVSDQLRQQAKQICYGIIYGMGSKALSEELNIEECQASEFMETFRNAYPSVKNYIKKIVEDCREKGYVETLAGRRRFLPNIKHKHGAVRSQAERQAVNTTTQGSAADLVKATMIRLEGKLDGNLVLHLHDELLYEVPVASLESFVKILKKEMEDSVRLSIPFPVKIKTGSSWGQMTEFKL